MTRRLFLLDRVLSHKHRFTANKVACSFRNRRRFTTQVKIAHQTLSLRISAYRNYHGFEKLCSI